MSDQNVEEDAVRKNHSKPYGGKHPIPTIQGYRQHRKEIEDQYGSTKDAQHEPQDDSKPRRAYASAKTILKGEDESESQHEPYPSTNHNDEPRPHREEQHSEAPAEDKDSRKHGSGRHHGSKGQEKSGTEEVASAIDPKQKRKAMKKTRTGGGREVTDPVTHLPIVIHDQTEKDLDAAPENAPPPGSSPRTATGLSGASKTQDQLDDEQEEGQRSYNGLRKTFPPPDFHSLEQELAAIYKSAITAGLGAILVIAACGLAAVSIFQYRGSTIRSRLLVSSFIAALTFGVGYFVVIGIQGWLDKKITNVWEDGTWDALRKEEQQHIEDNAELPESVQWLNSLLTSIWPLVNPDLFASLVDMLEDVMQASLPKVVRMVSVDDMGQGNQSVRILGVKWLPTGAASHFVDEEGALQKPEEASNDKGKSMGLRAGETEAEKKKKEEQQQQERAGMAAEEGDFVNMELAFAYRARSSGKSIKEKANNAHLYLKFYFPGGIMVPVWVELRGIIGIMRLRLQLTPDPPFFSVCTLTFLGQPKADLSCIPLSKHSLNIMDVPLISSFVQSAIDAALAEYVAPKSLTLDLKEMLMGEDFKKDTASRGVVWIFIKQARDFKHGDGGFGPFEGSSDAYVTVSWGKFGKPVASTRIIVDDQTPNWHEWASILVSPDEINAGEKLRLQLWDSDKWTADDDLGRVEVDLKELMNNPDKKNKMCDRQDRLKAPDAEEDMPGCLSWSVGYFEKTRITDMQLKKQTFAKEIRTKKELKKHVSEKSERKLREAKLQSEHDDELHQQKAQDYKEQEDNMMISAPPSPDHKSGILGIQIHNITGLEVQNQQKQERGEQDPEDDDHASTNLPDSYCTVIMNHRKIYKTRTKPKNAKPFFNAGTERFVKDWSTTEIIVSVRDSREKEDDPLLGVVYLPLCKLFEKSSQVMDNFPLVGGIGYGRARISMVWRSVELQLPPHLSGWDYGTLEIKGAIRAKGQISDRLQHDRLKIRTNLSRTKMYPADDGTWTNKKKDADNSAFLAVRARYSSAMIVEFRKSKIGPDKTPGFAVLWLSELTDEEENIKTLRVWKGGKKNLQRAEACCDYNGLEQDEQGLGEIEMTLKFWRGLSGYHKGHAAKSKNADVRNVMECLDTINDENMDDLYDHDDGSSDSDTETESSNPNSPHRNRGNTTSSTSTNPATRSPHDPDDIETRKKLRAHTNQSDTSNSDDSDLESSESSGFTKLQNPVNAIQSAASKITDKVTGDQNTQDDASRGLRAQVQEYKQNHRQLHRKHRGIMQWKSVRTLDWAGGKAKRVRSKVGEMFEHGEKGQGIETEV